MSGKLPTYRFVIEFGATTLETAPIWGDDVKIKKSREQRRVFFRSEITGTFKFVRDDFDAILSAATIDDKITLTIEEFSGTWDLFAAGFFYLTDCEIDNDNRVLTASISPDDKYTEILAALDKEFDLIQLDVPRVSVNVATQPVFQIYAPGATYLNNYLNGTHWEQEVIEPLLEGSPELAAAFTGTPFFFFYIAGDASVLDPDVSGQYLNDPNPPYFGYTRTDGAFAVTFDIPLQKWKIVDYGTGTTVYLASTSGPANSPAPGLNWKRDNYAVTYESVTTASTCRAMLASFYCRLLTNEATVNGTPSDPIPSPDIVAENYNYSRMVPVLLNTVVGSSLHDPNEGRFGKFAYDAHQFADEYFVRPSGLGVGGVYPINRSEWTESSAWFYFDATLNDLQEYGKTTRIVEDAYKIADVLSAILGEVDPTVTHQESAVYSDFFYGPSNPIRGSVKYPILTPKTNISLGEYDKPAQKAPIKLSEIFNLFEHAHGVFWWIDENDRLCLEHLYYFENGKSYTTPGIGVDLTTLFEPKTAKAWAYRTNKYKYDKPKLFEVKRFAWMDDVTRPFAGYPIESLAGYVERGLVEEANLSPFTSDIDFCQVQPNEISKDGFCFMEADFDHGSYELPFVTVTIDAEEEYKLQNGWAALVFMVDAYLRERLPSWSVKINDRTDTADSVVRMRVQEIRHPGDVDPMLLVTTILGDGRVMTLETTLSTRMNKIVLYHDHVFGLIV